MRLQKFAFSCGLILLLGSLELHAGFRCDYVFSPHLYQKETWSKKISLHEFDFDSKWGTKLFLDTDPMWKDRDYRAKAKELLVPDISNYNGGPGVRAQKSFKENLAKLTSGEVLMFANTGTDANNLLFLAANKAYKNRHTQKDFSFENADIIFIGTVYGGVFGPVASNKYKYALDAPSFTVGDKNVDVVNLERKEKEILHKIDQLLSSNKPIGGIFIEPVMVADHLQMFRTDFLLQLRELADRHKTPIFADEVFTGGGKTGKFWAYEHYTGFVPDLVTFGKGLIVSGVFLPAERASHNRDIQSSLPGLLTTNAAHPMALLQGAHILKNIHDRDLIKNAEVMGHYLAYKTQLMPNIDQSYYSDFFQPRNLGLIAFDYEVLLNIKMGVRGRMNLPLTTSPQFIDKIFNFAKAQSH